MTLRRPVRIVTPHPRNMDIQVGGACRWVGHTGGWGIQVGGAYRWWGIQVVGHTGGGAYRWVGHTGGWGIQVGHAWLVSTVDDLELNTFCTMCLQEMIRRPDSKIICVFWEFDDS